MSRPDIQKINRTPSRYVKILNLWTQILDIRTNKAGIYGKNISNTIFVFRDMKRMEENEY